jgi:hypothetical protein
VVNNGVVELNMNDNIGNKNIGKLNVVSNVWSQVVINSTFTEAGDPSEIVLVV